MKFLLSNILSYDEIIKNDIKSIGVKAYNVALLSKSFNVPKGVVIYDLPVDINEIKKVLNCDKYIVRSSANVEDSSNLSWAGCFDSIPNVLDNELNYAINTCIDSKNNRRVKEYMKLHNICNEVKISVIIQEYIESDYNGVAFSVNPVNDDDSQYVIELQKGLTGNVVGGFGNSETLIIDKKRPVINCINLEKKKILELIEIIKKIENIINNRVDIEFLISKGKIFITQARPITT